MILCGLLSRADAESDRVTALLCFSQQRLDARVLRVPRA
jgi:hypothetical protein